MARRRNGSHTISLLHDSTNAGYVVRTMVSQPSSTRAGVNRKFLRFAVLMTRRARRFTKALRWRSYPKAIDAWEDTQ